MTQRPGGPHCWKVSKGCKAGKDFALYGEYIPLILAAPDYVALNAKDGSIEYVKEVQVNSVYVKVAVRVSARGQLFARSVYRLNTNRVLNFIEKGTLKRY